MSFTSLGFLPFLAAVLLLYRVFPRKWRWTVLLPASYFFYACHNVWLLGLILLTTLTSWLCALWVERTPRRGLRRLALGVDLGVCLGILFLFKYLDFALGGLFALVRLFGGNVTFSGFSLLLPMGISFYVFQTLSYTLDVYWGRIPAERNLGYYALFVAFFPQLVAGPIERPGALLPQLRQAPDPDPEDLDQGVRYLVRGYAKKVLVADTLARFVDAAYGDPAAAGGCALVLATGLFALQIYCDFSGYSDIALGCARCMGIRLTENFHRPYAALSLQDFWRRWHISLTRWFTDYVYIPLGGNRKGLARQCGNILLVFLASGLWHGADVTFLLWGGIHGVCLVAETLLGPRREGLPRFWKRVLTLLPVGFAWIFFRAADLSQVGLVLRTVLLDFRPENLLSGLAMGFPELLTLMSLLALLPRLEALPTLSEGPEPRRTVPLYFLLIAATVFCRWIALSQGGDTAFLYFQF